MSLAALLALALAGPARAAAPAAHASFDGEQVTWEVHYAGVAAGTAWARTTASPDGSLALEGGAQNAPWYGKLYHIDDLVQSTWVPGEGSRRYRTRFREGGFHQDQDMVRQATGFSVWRKQEIDGAWKEWTRSYDSEAGAEDPISAIQRLRLLDDADQVTTPLGVGWSFPVFSGERTWPLVVRVVDHDALEVPALGGRVPVRVVELTTTHKGMLEQRGRFRIWLTEDARRIPVRLSVRSNFGTIRADLVAYTAPAGEPAVTPAVTPAAEPVAD